MDSNQQTPLNNADNMNGQIPSPNNGAQNDERTKVNGSVENPKPGHTVQSHQNVAT